MEHTIITGARGGQYWLDENNKKHYVSQQGPVAKPRKSVNRLPTPAEQKKVHKRSESPNKDSLNIYVGYYYQLDRKGYRIDDFKEWCWAYNKEQAEEEFKSRYWKGIENGSIELSMVCLKQ